MVMFLGGLVLLVVGANLLVRGVSRLALSFGISPFVVGLTIVAFGTRAPEVVVSVGAVLDDRTGIAVGNIVGSNTINIFGCLGHSSLVSGDLGLVLAPSLIAFDIWVMLVVALACLPVFVTGREIARWGGGLFLAYCVAYAAFLMLAAQQYDALPALSAVMLGSVVPLTVVTLVVVVLIHRPAVSASRD